MLQESCLKFYLKQLSHNISVANISSLRVINDIKFHIDVNKKCALGRFGRMFFRIALPLLKTAQGVSKMGILVFFLGGIWICVFIYHVRVLPIIVKR